MRVAVAGITGIVFVGCLPAMRWSAMSPDHRTTVGARSSGGQTCLRITAAPEQCHDGIALDELVFSDSGGHLAYPARIGERWTVVRDGRPGLMWDGVASPVYSPNGARLAYAALDRSAWRVVVNDSAGEPFDSLFAHSITFDPTGRRLGYVARRGDSTHTVIDGTRSLGWEGLAQLTFSPDGTRVGYLARSARGVGLVVDGQAGLWHEGIGALALSSSSDRAAYTAIDGGQWSVVEGMHRWGPYSAVRGLAFAPGGGPLVWIARDGTGERVFRDGIAGSAWDSVGAVVSSTDGARWGYVAYDNAGAAIVLDGAVMTRETWAANLVLSPDGSRVVYLSKRAGSSVVVDDRGVHPFDLLVDGTLLFLGNGETWACLAGDVRRRRLFVTVEGITERRPFDWQENTRLIQRDPTGTALRAWVMAEAELLLTGGIRR